MHIQFASAAGPAERTIPKTGAQNVVDALLAHGVDTVFGYTGASVIPLFGRLYETSIRVVVPYHEQGGCHMADAYARASGKTGVIIATSGPGACNLVTGLATAMMDSIPRVAITGQVRTDLIGDDALQEAPTTGITVNQKDQVGPTVEQMLRQDRCCVVDFHVDPEESVLPMAPPGKGLNEMEGLRVLQNAM